MGNTTGLRPFPRGVSPNPGGRPKALVEIEAMCRQLTPQVVEALFKIATEGRNEQARVAAGNALLDRAWGRPRLDVHLEATAGEDLLHALESARLRVKLAAHTLPIIEAVAED